MSIDRYTKFISEQAKSKVFRSIQEEHKVPAEITKHDPDAYHVGSTKEGHHVYAVGDTDRGEFHGYAVKHPDGKITQHGVEHGGELPSKKDLDTKSDWHDVHDLHPSVKKIIHKDLKDELE